MGKRLFTHITAVAAFLFCICAAVLGTPIIERDNKTFYCSKGEYLDSVQNVCVPCPSGHYMDEDLHNNKNCNKCSYYDSDMDYVQSTYACTATTNTAIEKCIDGYYIDVRPLHYGCRICPLCEGSSKYIAECCDGQPRSTTPSPLNPLRSTTERVTETAFFKTTLTSSVTRGHADTLKNRTAMALTRCQGLNPERCQDAGLRTGNCSSESQLESVKCDECPQCRPVTSVQGGLSSGETVGVAVGSSFGGVVLLVIAGIIVYFKYFKDKEYHLASTTRTGDDEL